MKKKLLMLLLLFSMSFSTLHAFVIKALDTHACQVSEYVHDINEQADESSDGDICHIDHFFHIAFIIPELDLYLEHQSFSQKPLSHDNIYEYNSYDNFLKPPIYS